MKIMKDQIDRIKKQHELVATVEAHGVRLKKRGKEYVGLCPFHKEKTPSFSVDPIKQVFHCFGCGASGDTLGFLCKIESKPLSTLIKELSHKTNGSSPVPPHAQLSTNDSHTVVNKIALSNGAAHVLSPSTAIPLEDPPQTSSRPAEAVSSLRPSALKLLARVVEFYQGVFAKDPKGREYLSGRGIKDKEALRDFGVGYANGSLLDALPPEGDWDTHGIRTRVFCRLHCGSPS